VQKLIAAKLIAKQDEPGRPSEFIVLEVRKRFQKPAAHSGTARWGAGVPPTADTHTAHSGRGIPLTAEHLPLTAAHLPPTAARNKEERLSQNFSQDLRGNRPAWMIAQKQFWDEFERQAPRPGSYIANAEAERFQRFRAAANRVGLTATQAKNILLEHPAWKSWPYTAALDSRQEIIFPPPEKTNAETTYPEKPRPVAAERINAETWAAQASPESEAQATAAWEHVHDFVKARISANSYNTWVKPLRAVALHDGTLMVRIPTTEFKHVGKKFGDLIRQALTGLQNGDLRSINPGHPVRVTEMKFVTQEEIAEHPRARSA
jgi:hypothetical protein